MDPVGAVSVGRFRRDGARQLLLEEGLRPENPLNLAERGLGARGRLAPEAALGDQERQHRLPTVSLLLLGFGVKPALLLGEPVCQHVDERAYLGAQVPAVG